VIFNEIVRVNSDQCGITTVKSAKIKAKCGCVCVRASMRACAKL